MHKQNASNILKVAHSNMISQHSKCVLAVVDTQCSIQLIQNRPEHGQRILKKEHSLFRHANGQLRQVIADPEIEDVLNIGLARERSKDSEDLSVLN